MRSDQQAGITHDFSQGASDSRPVEAGASLSGLERNHLFMSLGGRRFVDVSGVSGLDDPADGRSFALLDYDRDGWQDIALVNANAPLMQLYHNELGGLLPERDLVALRFVGGNRSAAPAAGLSARDGFGARVSVELDGRRIVREHRAGEGFASQNSATMIVGLGEHPDAVALTVQWPSGRVQEIAQVPSGSLVTLYEDAAMSPSGEPAVIEVYRRAPAGGLRVVERDTAPLRASWPELDGADLDEQPAALRFYTTFATWCQNCRTELPQLERLRAEFDRDTLAMFAVPYDEKEDRETQRAWTETYSPPYRLLNEIGHETIAEVQKFVTEQFQVDGIPASIVVGPDRRVLLSRWGPPNVSEIRRLLDPARRR